MGKLERPTKVEIRNYLKGKISYEIMKTVLFFQYSLFVVSNNTQITSVCITAPFIFAIFYSLLRCFAIKWVLNPIEKLVAKQLYRKL